MERVRLGLPGELHQINIASLKASFANIHFPYPTLNTPSEIFLETGKQIRTILFDNGEEI